MKTQERRMLPPLPAAHERWAFFLDIDGTLLSFVDTPSALHADAEFLRLLERLHATHEGAVALISGRPLDNLARLVAPLALPMAGQHGLERRDAAGRTHRRPYDAAALRHVADAARGLVLRHPELELEDKGMTLALHFRRAPQLGDEVRRTLVDCLAGGVRGLAVQPGKMVVEVKPAGWDKGKTIDEFLAEPPFSGRLPVFVGDDVTDEYGFETVNGLGGITVKVGAGDTAAGYRLPDVAAVRGWLAEVIADKDRASSGDN